MKKLYAMNDRHDCGKGYTEVTQEYIDGYIKGCGDDKPYFINLGYAVMEVTKEDYIAFYKERRRERYIKEEARNFGEVSLNALDSDEFQGSNVIVDMSEPLDEQLIKKMMIEKLPEMLQQLKDDEQELIRKIYFEGISERAFSKIMGIPLTTVNNHKKKILKKLFSFFEK